MAMRMMIMSFAIWISHFDLVNLVLQSYYLFSSNSSSTIVYAYLSLCFLCLLILIQKIFERFFYNIFKLIHSSILFHHHHQHEPTDLNLNSALSQELEMMPIIIIMSLSSHRTVFWINNISIHDQVICIIGSSRPIFGGKWAVVEAREQHSNKYK